MKKIFFMLIMTGVIISCKKKEDEPVTPTCSGTMTVNQDGSALSATGFNNTLLKAIDMGEASRRLDIRTNISGGTLILSVSNWDFQNPPVNGVLSKIYYNATEDSYCEEMNGASYCDGMLGTFMREQQSLMTFDESLPGNITISSIDGTNKTVSGSYDFYVTEIDDSDTIRFNGTFTNLCYSVLQ